MITDILWNNYFDSSKQFRLESLEKALKNAEGRKVGRSSIMRSM